MFLKSCSIPIHFPMKKPCSDWMESLTPMSVEAGPDKIIQLAEGVWGYQMVKGHQQPWARDGTTAPAQLHVGQLQWNREAGKGPCEVMETLGQCYQGTSPSLGTGPEAYRAATTSSPTHLLLCTEMRRQGWTTSVNMQLLD